jgi:hypothetical protein
MTKPTKLHLTNGNGRAACGVRPDLRSHDPEATTCLRCRRSLRWHAAHPTMTRTLALWPARGAHPDELLFLCDDVTIGDYVESMLSEGDTGRDATQCTERGEVLGWLLDHPRAAIRWRLFPYLVDEVPW